MKARICPINDKVLLKREDPEETTRSGIYLPDKAREKLQEAIVVAVGPGKLMDDGKRAAPQVKEGEKVLIGKWAGTELRIEDEEMLVMSEDDILAVVR